MIATRQPILIANNAAFDIAARWENEDGDPYELTDAVLQIRIRAGAPDVILEASVDNGLITLASPDWWAAVLFEESDTAAIETFGFFAYDLVVTRDIDGRTEQLLYGPAVLKQGVTVLA